MAKLKNISLLLFMAVFSLAHAADETPLQLPYKCTFETAEIFLGDWISVGNTESTAWEWGEWPKGPDGSTGVASCPTDRVSGNDEYLISRPAVLEAGKYNITFAVKGVRADATEVLELCIGESDDVKTMKPLNRWMITSNQWQTKVLNFEVEKAGTYRIALHSLSKEGFNTYIDDLTIGEGELQLLPDLKIEKIILPYSQCDYSVETTIGVKLANMGNGAAKGVTMKYKVNDGKEVAETFDAVELQPEGNAVIYFKTPADMSATIIYDISVTAESMGNSATASANVVHKETLQQLPENCNFMNGESFYWEGYLPDSWKYDKMGQYMTTSKTGEDNGLFSRCIYADVPLRLKFAYSGGIFAMTGAMKLIMGLSGTDISTWKTVYEDKETTRDGAEREIEVKDVEPGYYTFAFVNTSEKKDVPLNVYYINISGVYDYDLRAVETRTAMAAYTPAEQYNSRGRYAMTVENRGTKNIEKVNIAMGIGADKCFAQDVNTNIAPGESTTLTIEGTMPASKPGDVIKGAKIVADVEGEKYSDDNFIEFDDIEVTDTVFATENVKEFVKGIGLSNMTAKFGNVYTLNTADTLTSVTIGLAEDPAYKPRNIGISVYALSDDGHTVGRSLLDIVTERGAKGGLRTFTFSPRLLPAGNYYVEAYQTTFENMGMAYDETDTKGVFYQSDGMNLFAIKGSGAIALRMNFGHGAELSENDAHIKAFTLPLKDKALFGVNENVGVKVINLGTDEIKDMKMTCSVDGAEKAATTVSLLPYETKEVVFRDIDLSAVGEHEIAVSAELNGDENPADNTLKRTVTTVAEASPYKLDFEQCDDFDHGTMFNPRWRTEDRLGLPTNAWSFYDYPHKAEPVGFMAFNTEATVPVITNIPGFYAHEGKRFGAAFATGLQSEVVESDVWLISPKLALKDNSSLKLFVKTYAIEMYNKPERYKILVSETDDDYNSFEAIGGVREAAVDEWEEVTVDLSRYDNKNVYIALQYVSTSLEGVVMMVDDIEVLTGATGTGIGKTVADDITLSANGRHIQLKAGEELTKVSIFNVSGVEVYSCAPQTDSLVITSEFISGGIYIVKAETKSGEKIFKIKI